MRWSIFLLITIAGCVPENHDFRIGEFKGRGITSLVEMLKQEEAKDSKWILSGVVEVEKSPLITIQNNNSLYELLKIKIQLNCKTQGKANSAKEFFTWKHRDDDLWKYDDAIAFEMARRIKNKARKLCS